jgi:hypothetical protein
MGRTASTVRRGMRTGAALVRRADGLVARGAARNAEVALEVERARRAQWSTDALAVDGLAAATVPVPRGARSVVPLPRKR